MPAIEKNKLDQFRKGQIRFTQLFQFHGNQIASLLLCGYNFFNHGRLQEAKNIFEGLSLLDPNIPYVSCVLGAIYQRLEKIDLAILHYNHAIALFPQDIVALTNRAEIYLGQGKFLEAADDLKKVIELDRENKNPSANRARMLAAITSESLQSINKPAAAIAGK
ncbi:type III secretion protein [bacterium]|nr:type III secretion protein [bacterium]